MDMNERRNMYKLVTCRTQVDFFSWTNQKVKNVQFNFTNSLYKSCLMLVKKLVG